jgi:hypothetical protein
MLMPSPEKALLKAKELLTENGRIVFLLTMHKNRNRFMEIIKPAIKYLTSIDFGKMTYEDQFLGLLDTFNLRIMNSERLGENLFSKQMLFRFCNVWVFETAVARMWFIVGVALSDMLFIHKIEELKQTDSFTAANSTYWW